MKEIVFRHLRCGVSIAGALDFKGGRLIADPNSRGTFPIDNSGTVYCHINAIAVCIQDENNSGGDTQGDVIQKLLFESLLKANECLAALAARCQSYAFLEIPIECEYDGKAYLLNEHRFELKQYLSRLKVIDGGTPCSDISFLDTAAEDDPVYDFYREARNDHAPFDYRVLQAWRFFEGWFGLQGDDLKQALKLIGTYKVFKGWHIDTGEELWDENIVNETFVDSFYKHARNFVAHGTKVRKKKSGIPRESQSDHRLFSGLVIAIEIADHLLRSHSKLSKDLQH